MQFRKLPVVFLILLPLTSIALPIDSAAYTDGGYWLLSAGVCGLMFGVQLILAFRSSSAMPGKPVHYIASGWGMFTLPAILVSSYFFTDMIEFPWDGKEQQQDWIFITGGLVAYLLALIISFRSIKKSYKRTDPAK